MLLALWGARDFNHYWRKRGLDAGFAPDVSILKPVKGVDQRMYAGFVSHCRQVYAGRFELVFGVGSLDDPAVAEIERLKAEFPECAIRLVECRERLGTSGKVSNLVQMLCEARYDYVLVNDSDICCVFAVSVPGDELLCGCSGWDGYGSLYWADFGGSNGLVAAGGAGNLDGFLPGVLTARKLGGWDSVWVGIDAGDESSGACEGWWVSSRWSRVWRTTMRWERGSLLLVIGWSCARRWWRRRFRRIRFVVFGIIKFDGHERCAIRARWVMSGLGVTYALPWAVMACVASGFELWSFSLLSVVLLARVAVALAVGVGVLRDGQVLRDLWLLAAAGFLWAVVLGVELCGRYGGLAGSGFG